MTAAERIQAQSGLVLPTYADVEDSGRRGIEGVAHHTPALTSRTANAGAPMPASSSRPRTCSAWAPSSSAAATMRSRRCRPSRRRPASSPISSGNHAQAIAYAGKLLGVPTTIIMPRGCARREGRRPRSGYGGEIVRYDRYTEDRLEIGAKLAPSARPDPDPAL